MKYLATNIKTYSHNNLKFSRGISKILNGIRPFYINADYYHVNDIITNQTFVRYLVNN